MNENGHRYIEATYELDIERDGKLEAIEATTDAKPIRFYTGVGMVLGAFENHLNDIAEGEDYSFVIPMDEAYGEHREDMVVDIPKDVFSTNGSFNSEQVYVGASIPLQNENGQRFIGTVVELGDNSVSVDLNHPLAGKDLVFKGRVLVNHEVSDEEVADFQSRLKQHHCGGCHGGGCGNCGSGDCCGGCH